MLPAAFTLRPEGALPAIGFGTYLVPPDQAAETVEAAIRTGYRHVDTAQDYGNEVGVGEGIRAGLEAQGLSRDDIFVTTKFMPHMHGEPSTADDLTRSALASLERLGLPFVDLFLIHAPFGGPNRVAMWEAVLALQEAGKIRAGGVSNYAVVHLQELADAGLPLPAANQLELHPWSQKPELIGWMAARDIVPIAYSSLVPLANWRPDNNQGKTQSMDRDAVIFTEFAAKYGVSEAQFLLRWGLQKGFAIIPKSMNEVRMGENFALDGFAISDEDMAQIEAMDRGDGVAWGSINPLARA